MRPGLVRDRPSPALAAVGVLALLGASGSCATAGRTKAAEPDLITGLVLDAEGSPIAFAKVAMVPTGPALSEDRKGGESADPLPEGARGLAVTTESGRFDIDHLSDAAGTAIGLPPSWFYEVTVYKPGYHAWKESVEFQRGTVQVDVTLYPDTISLEDLGNLVDTKLGDTNTGVGVLRQGQ